LDSSRTTAHNTSENDSYDSNLGKYNRLEHVLARGKHDGSCIGINSPLGDSIGTTSIIPIFIDAIGTDVTKFKNCRRCVLDASNSDLIKKVIVGDDGPNRRLIVAPPSPPIAATATKASVAPFPPVIEQTANKINHQIHALGLIL
jgi:hypothetical protein